MVLNIVYFLCIYFFFASIIFLIYSKKTDKKNYCKYVRILSILYIFLLILDLVFIPEFLELECGFEIVFFRIIMFISITLYVVTIILSNKKYNYLKVDGNLKVFIKGFIIIICFPIVLFIFSYLREKYYINNSNLIILYDASGEFDSDYAYAMSDNYYKEISIGVGSSDMKKIIPNDFKEFKYNWSTDKIVVENNKIVLYDNNELIYEEKIYYNIVDYDIDEIYYR